MVTAGMPNRSDTSGAVTTPAHMPATRPKLGGFTALLVLSLLVNMLFLTGPIFMMQVYDRVLSSGSVPTLIGLFVITVILYLGFGVFDTLRQNISILRGEELAGQFEADAFKASIRATAEGANDARLLAPEDVDAVRSYLTSPAVLALFDLPALPLFFLGIFFLHPMLGTVAIVAGIILGVLAVLNERMTRKQMVAAQPDLTAGTRILTNARREADSLAGNSMLNASATYWVTMMQNARQKLMRGQRTTATFGSITKTLRLAIQSLVLGVGAWLAIEGHMTAGAMIAASIVFSRAIAPLEQVLSSWRNLLRAHTAWHRLKNNILPADESSAFTLPAPVSTVEAVRIGVAAPGSEHLLVQDVTFALSSGNVLAIAGPSGVGKSCLARALVGAWPIESGHLKLDKADLALWPADTLAQHIGYLGQTVEFVDARIRDIIARLDPNADDKSILSAAQQAGVHEFILSLPDGYDTFVGVGGIQLSGGQRQRIGLARALYGDPFFVVLDEPTAHLDGAGEHALFVAIKARSAAGKITALTVHDERNLGVATHMLVLENGRMVISGPRDAVMKKIRANRNPEQASA